MWMAKKNINDKTLSINEHFCGDTDPIYRAAKTIEKIQSQSLPHRRHSTFFGSKDLGLLVMELSGDTQSPANRNQLLS